MLLALRRSVLHGLSGMIALYRSKSEYITQIAGVGSFVVAGVGSTWADLGWRVYRLRYRFAVIVRNNWEALYLACALAIIVLMSLVLSGMRS